MQSNKQGITASHTLQQQGSKKVQTGRPHNMVTLGLTKGTILEEFKHGFPSEGLSTTSNRWWGSISPDRDEGVRGEAAKTDEDSKHQSDSRNSVTVNKEKYESSKENLDPQGTDVLMAVRKRAVEEVEKALKLGVFRGYGAKKLGRREKTLLFRIFKSSMPKEWMLDST